MSTIIKAESVVPLPQPLLGKPILGEADRILDLLPAAVCVCDRDGRIVRYNRKAVELWGRSPKLGDPAELLCGSLRMHYLDGGALPHADCPMAEVLRTGVAMREQEVVIERPDGSRAIALVDIDPLRDSQGSIAGAINCFRDITERKRVVQEPRTSQSAAARDNALLIGQEATLRESEQRLSTELSAVQRLQEISTLLIQEDEVDVLYHQVLDAAVALMRSDMASMQMLHHDRGELRLLAWKGFHPDSAAFWEWVRLDSDSTCGAALSSGERVVVQDVETCEFMAGTADLDAYRLSGIRAVQSTPLVSRSGRMLGMISTHWREPHQPAERDLRLLDVLARQAADLIERAQVEAALRERERHARELLEALPAAVYTTDAAGRITSCNQAAVDLWGDRPELGKSEWCGSWRLYWPDGRPMPHDECPMAVALKEGRAIKGAEAVAERADGTRVPFLAYPTPLRDESGALVGAVNMLVRITERKRAEEVAARLASIVESSDDAIVSKDLDGIIASWNPGAERLFGYAAEEVVGKPIAILLPPDRHDEESDILRRIRRGEHVDPYETVRRCKDGSLVEISLTVSPVKNAEGRIIGASKIARDITERRRAQEQQNLLLREMSHRVKNLFALAGGVVTLSARSARTPDDMSRAVRERLAALARAHELTLPDITKGADGPDQATSLHAVVRTIVSPYIDPEPDHEQRVVVEGPDVPIGGNAVTSVALLLHELATNAAKHGALSSPTGRVDLSCSVEEGELLLTWKEHDGPRLDGPAGTEGFGSLLARRTVTGQFGGRIAHDWKPEGLTVSLSLPLERLTK